MSICLDLFKKLSSDSNILHHHVHNMLHTDGMNQHLVSRSNMPSTMNLLNLIKMEYNGFKVWLVHFYFIHELVILLSKN